MEYKCTLCNYYTNGSEFNWESHLASSEHRIAALETSAACGRHSKRYMRLVRTVSDMWPPPITRSGNARQA